MLVASTSSISARELERILQRATPCASATSSSSAARLAFVLAARLLSLLLPARSALAADR